MQVGQRTHSPVKTQQDTSLEELADGWVHKVFATLGSEFDTQNHVKKLDILPYPYNPVTRETETEDP